MANTYMPITLSMKQRTCLVVGGGAVALRKVDTLLDYETTITVVAPEINEKLEYYATKNLITVEKRPYKSPEAGNYGLVIAASDADGVNHQVRDDCVAASVLVNVVDDPSRCDFIFPAVLRRDCLTTAISTDGKAPFVSSHLRVILSNIFPAHWNPLMRYAAAFRKRVQEHWGSDAVKKEACFADFLETDWKTLLKNKDKEAIEAELISIIDREETSAQPSDE
ncbi:MAG: hypothetical protein DRP45_02535 [Candidatus Zixiibacteriota bacterium]|nr:MAG: hypothetical protein DRP45_02535 [candidate division Zixibacteria bacterium]